MIVPAGLGEVELRELAQLLLDYGERTFRTWAPNAAHSSLGTDAAEKLAGLLRSRRVELSGKWTPPLAADDLLQAVRDAEDHGQITELWSDGRHVATVTPAPGRSD